MINKDFIKKSILPGFLIGIAGWIFLRCENKLVGSLLFTIGLIFIILSGSNLYTGKVGYINTKEKLIQGLVMLAFNLTTAYIVGLVYRLTYGVSTIYDSRIDVEWYKFFLTGIITGVCVYIAVEGYKLSKSLIIAILPVMAFILSSSYHCVAEAFYFGASSFNAIGLLNILIVIIGNSVGSFLIHLLQYGFKDKNIENTK